MNIIPIFYEFTNIFNEKIVFTKSGKYAILRIVGNYCIKKRFYNK